MLKPFVVICAYRVDILFNKNEEIILENERTIIYNKEE